RQSPAQAAAWTGSPRQREGDVLITRRRPHLPAAGRDYDVLPPVDLVRGRGGVASGRKVGLPEDLARPFVEGAELLVRRGTDEDQAAGGHGRPAVVLCPRSRDSPRRQLLELAERHCPQVFTGVQVDGVERSPGRLDGRIALRIEEAV